MELRATPIHTLANAKNGKQIARITKGGRSEKEMMLLTKRLANCWNSHDAMLTVLNQMDEYLDGKTMKLRKGQLPINTISSRSIFHNDMKQAIAQAEKEI